MRYFIIAGEASGDAQGAGLVAGLKTVDPTAEIHCWGGDLMVGEGASLRKHYRELAFMGFVEVLKNLPTIIENIKSCKSQIIDFQPDALILIDYPGFNLRLASWAKKQGFKVFYFISPQLWAWHSSRVKIIRESVDLMLVIFPFEVDFYKKYGVDAVFVGHPMVGLENRQPAPERAAFFEQNRLDPARPILALLPGSRKQEIRKMLEIMLSTSTHFPDFQAVIAGAPSQDRGQYQPYLDEFPNAVLVENQTRQLLKNAKIAMVTSGTATLETALLDVPQVVCYRANNLSYRLAKLLVNKDLRFISIVNIIAGKAVVPELIQADLTVENLKTQLDLLLNPAHQTAMKTGYSLVRTLLGSPGAGKRAAERIVGVLNG